jgi:hypothetical protein
MKTGWQSRNQRLIEEAIEEARRRGMEAPTLIDIAPGLVTRLLNPYFSPGDGLRNRLLEGLDNLLRRTGSFAIDCHEVLEILEISASLSPKHLYVLYADPDVARAIPESDIMVLNPTDVSTDRLLEFGDIVFCYNNIQDTRDPKGTLENVLHSVKPGGLLSIDTSTDWRLDPRTDPMFVRITNNLYAKEF